MIIGREAALGQDMEVHENVLPKSVKHFVADPAQVLWTPED
ncbi:hypothetical protein [Microvirga massiliensis]|nr:hypothetical protein [Microvirga massiliensis]